MKILVFGAAGKTGREVVIQALSQGHQVTAFLNEQELGKTKKLEHFFGDVLSADSVLKAMQPGFDAIISCLGNNHGNSPTCSEGVKNIISCAYLTGISRLICVSSLGLAPEFNSFYFNTVVLPLFFRDVHLDLEKMEKLITNSNLNWTIVRPPQLIDKIRTGNYRILTEPPENRLTEIARADVADFILKELENSSFIRQKVAIGY
jgi:putative NADH-flavin reductase